MTFEEYLIKKRINKDAFAAEDPARYLAWESMYAQMHPNSFYVAVKMVLNNVRLRYHLREEDVPKPAATAAPRPAARRAAPSAAIPETPVGTNSDAPAIPAATDVPQETTEEKQVTPAAVPKPRPVVRRPAALQNPETGDQTASEKPAEGTTPATPKARPVIKRPVISKLAADPTIDKPAEADSPVPQEPVAPRARAVIKRPAALSKPPLQPASETHADNAIPEQPAAANPSAEPAKPARPRPVIKRPAALQKPVQEQEEATVDRPAPNPDVPAAGMAPTGDAAAETPKPPRPRPVIRRPTVLQKPVQEEDSPGAEEKPAAAEGTANDNPSQFASEGTPKPPRPRPIIKRPAPAAASTGLDQTANPKVEGQQKPEDEPSGVPPASIPEEAPQPKLPRPRPIMRRPPPKTEE